MLRGELVTIWGVVASFVFPKDKSHLKLIWNDKAEKRSSYVKINFLLSLNVLSCYIVEIYFADIDFLLQTIFLFVCFCFNIVHIQTQFNFNIVLTVNAKYHIKSKSGGKCTFLLLFRNFVPLGVFINSDSLSISNKIILTCYYMKLFACK